jgi:hypothetical protein
MGAPTSSYATAGIDLRVSGALKPHHHDKVETPSVGISWKIRNLISRNFPTSVILGIRGSYMMGLKPL